MSRRTSFHTNVWTMGGRVPIAILLLVSFALLSFPMLFAGGGGGNSNKIEIQVPSCVPVHGELNVKKAVTGNLPSGGRFVWKVLGGTGVVQIRTRELDSSIPNGAAKIKGLKPGRVDLALEYRKKNSQGKDEVLASSETVSTIVYGATIEPAEVVATEGAQTSIRLGVIPPPDMTFVLQSAILEFRDATETVLSSWPYLPNLFTQDPDDPLRRILDTTFVPPAGLAGVSGLHLLFLATAQVKDPVSGETEVVKASATAPVTVKPVVSVPLSILFTGPASLEVGASGSLDIEIKSSDTANTTATFRILLLDGTEVQSSSIDLSGFQVSGDTMTGSYSFSAPSAPGLYILITDAKRDVEAATCQLGLTVTPTPEPEPWLDITTPSPIVAVEGGEVSVEFALGPGFIRHGGSSTLVRAITTAQFNRHRPRFMRRCELRT